MKHKKYIVIDLFSGIGGFSRGFQDNGFDVKLGIDNWDVALRTFRANHKNSKTILEDLTKLPDSFYKNLFYEVDVIIAGPPCQGFSMSGKRQQDDYRNKLFNEVIRAAKLTNPKIVIIENVVGLNSMIDSDGKLVKNAIIDSLKDLGYEVDSKILTASDYGVPQARRRIVFVGYKKNLGKFEFPEQINNPVSVGDAFGNLPDVDKTKYTKPTTQYQKLLASTDGKIYNHKAMAHNNDVRKRISLVPEGGNWKDIPAKYYQVGGNHSNNYRRLDRAKPSITIKHATKSMIIHPVFDRVITVREAARLQSFPDDFIIEGTVSEQHQQLANAVPPLLGYAIATSVKRYLDETD